MDRDIDIIIVGDDPSRPPRAEQRPEIEPITDTTFIEDWDDPINQVFQAAGPVPTEKPLENAVRYHEYRKQEYEYRKSGFHYIYSLDLPLSSNGVMEFGGTGMYSAADKSSSGMITFFLRFPAKWSCWEKVTCGQSLPYLRERYPEGLRGDGSMSGPKWVMSSGYNSSSR